MVGGAKVEMSSQYSTHFSERFNVDGSPSDVDLEGMFNAPQDYIDKIMGYSKYCYRKFGLIMRTVNLMRDFGSTGIKLQYPKKNAKIKDIINAYNDRVDINQFIRDSVMEMALTGNLACYDREGKRIDIYPINKIDVMPLVKDNKQMIAYKISDNVRDVDMYGQEYAKMIENAYPKEILEAVEKGNELAVLSAENAYFAKINASQYEPYGISAIFPAFEDLAHKSLLKEAEKSTANDVIDKIMMIKIGDADNKPSKGLIDQYTALFSGVKGAVRFTVPYYVDAKFVEPETKIFGAEKFVEVDIDILNTLGISLSLLRGSDGSNYADGILNFAGLTKTIENIRQPIARILEGLYKAELKRNGFSADNAPTVKFDDVVIDKEQKMSLIMEMFNNAGLPYRVLYEEAGYDFDHIKLIREEENSQNMGDTFKLHSLPFQGNLEENVDDGDGNEEDNKQDGQPVDKGGAPKKALKDRKSDKESSNNKAKRTGLTNTNRSAPKNNP